MKLKSAARQALKLSGLLEPSRKARQRINRFFRKPAPEVFYSLSPDLLVAIHSCLRRGEALDILRGSDYMEFGIYRGFAFWYAQAIACDMGVPDMRFFGFDSFHGLPEITGRDKDGDFREGWFCSGRPSVEGYLNQYGVDWKNTFLVDGFYSDTLDEHTKKASLSALFPLRGRLRPVRGRARSVSFRRTFVERKILRHFRRLELLQR